MNRIQKAFDDGKAFIAFLTAGDPSIEKTEEFILKLDDSGVKIVEIGIPFSDPIAEDDIVQESNIRALAGGVTTDKVFNMVKQVRAKTEMAIVLSTYMNPVFSYGNERFLNKCSECGVDGVFIPDLPFEEKDEVSEYCKNTGTALISAVTCESAERAKMISESSDGYICILPSAGNDKRTEFSTSLKQVVENIRCVSKTPSAVQLSSSECDEAKEAACIADGIIVKSGIVKIIGEYGDDAGDYIMEYAKKIAGVISDGCKEK